MTLEETTWDGTWTNSNGQNTYPYKTEDEPRDIHESREQATLKAEAKDHMERK